MNDSRKAKHQLSEWIGEDCLVKWDATGGLIFSGKAKQEKLYLNDDEVQALYRFLNREGDT